MTTTEIAPPGADFDRTPPHDIGAEQCALGGMLLSKDAIADVVETIRPDDYYRPAHQIIHEAILGLYEAGDPADAVTVADALSKAGLLAKVGGPPYLHTLIASVPTAANAGYYARIVKERAQFRRIVEAGTRIVQMGYSADGEIDEVTDRVRVEVDEATAVPGSKEDRGTRDILLGVLDDLNHKKARGLRTGWADVDAGINELGASQMIVVAARPAIGKSVIAWNMAADIVLRQHKRVVYFSLEMDADELMMRLLAAEARVPLDNLLARQLDEAQWDKLDKARVEIDEAADLLVIDDDSNTSLSRIRAKLRGMTRTGPADAVVVDHMGLMTSAGRPENRQNEVGAFSRGLKLLAREFGIPFIALSQLNRNPESRIDRKPMLSDLRDSGSVEQDADVVILLHREDAYDRESPRAGEIDLIVAKQRQGPTFTVTLAFQGHYARALDLAWTPSRAAA